MEVRSFNGEHRFLSNFWPAEVWLDGMCFRSVEHAYQAAKTTDRKERRRIQRAPKPGMAKHMGRRLKAIRPDWDEVKVGTMRDLLSQKFSNPVLRRMLAATGAAALFEGNTWGDRTWGVVWNGDVPEGWNRLGLMLMEIRDEAATR